MLATILPLDFPVPLSDVLAYLFFSALFGLALYGFILMALDTSSDDLGQKQRWQAPVLPLDATGWTLLVDGSNFAYRGDEVRLCHLLEVLAALRKRFENADIQVFCDANLRHKFGADDQRKFLAMVKRPDAHFHETHGKAADEVLLKHARKNPRCIVVSNDHFRDVDQLVLRIGVPLLKVGISRFGVRLSDKVDIFRDPSQPFRNSWVPVGRLINA